jgi:hypothetical protein
MVQIFRTLTSAHKMNFSIITIEYVFPVALSFDHIFHRKIRELNLSIANIST